jgi:hypothetical protein
MVLARVEAAINKENMVKVADKGRGKSVQKDKSNVSKGGNETAQR